MSDCSDDLVYLNVNFSGVESDTVSRVVQAEQTVSRSGNIVDCADGYVAVMRLAYSTNNPIIIAPCTSAQFTTDGLTTDWTITMRHTSDTGVLTYGVGSIRLPIEPANVVTGQTKQPDDLYAAFWSIPQWVSALNGATKEAYDKLVALVPSLGPQVPFFNKEAGSAGLLALNVFPYSLWEQTGRSIGSPGSPKSEYLDLGTAWKVQPALSGWGLTAKTQINRPLDANKMDYIFQVISDGYNYDPPNLVGSLALIPSNPSTTAMKIVQQFATQKLPGIVKVEVLSTLPTMGEYVPGENGKGAQSILTDFVPDTSQVMVGEAQTMLIYNAAIGDARWIKLKGHGPISTFSVRVATEDWLGKSRTFELNGRFEKFDMKLAFAPKSIIEHYK